MTTDSGSTVPPRVPVSADVPADEPVAPAVVEPAAELAAEPVAEPAAEPVEPTVWGAGPDQPEAPVWGSDPAAAPAQPEAPAVPAAAPGFPAAELSDASFPEVSDAAPYTAPPVAPEPGDAPPAAPAAPAPPTPEVPAEPAVPVVPPVPVEPAAPVLSPTAPDPDPDPGPVDVPDPGPVDVPATPELASAVPAPDAMATGLSGAGSAASELAPDQVVATGGGGAPRRGIVPIVVAAVVTALLFAGALAAWFGPMKEGREAQRLAGRRQDAVNQARQLALNIGTLNHQRLDEDLRRIADSTTGKARAEFDEKILKNEAYKKLVRDNQAQLGTTIVRLGLEPCGSQDDACRRGDTAVAIVFLDQESKNRLRPTPRVDRNRVALTLVRQGDKWLISEVQVL